MADGEDFSLGQLLEGYSKTHVILASIFISIATGIATVLCFLPGAPDRLPHVVHTLLHRRPAAGGRRGHRRECEDGLAQLRQGLLFFILAVIVLAIGALLLGIGLLVAAPVVVFGLAYTYRRLQGLPVVP